MGSYPPNKEVTRVPTRETMIPKERNDEKAIEKVNVNENPIPKTVRTNEKKIKTQSKPSRWDSFIDSASQFCSEISPARPLRALIKKHVDTELLQKALANPKAALYGTPYPESKANANGVTKVNRRLANQALIDRFIRESVRCQES